MRKGFFVQRFLSGGKPLYIQRFAENIPRFRRAGLPFTSMETCQEIRGLPWKPVSYGDSNENLKTCKLRGLQWKFEKMGTQFFWYVSTEVNGSPARWNLGIFSANLCMSCPNVQTSVQRFAPTGNLCTKNPILMDRTLSVTDGSIWIQYLARCSEIFKKPNFRVVKWAWTRREAAGG